MKTTVRLLAMFLASAWLLGAGVSSTAAAAEMCPMGGTMIMTETDRDKALAWGKARSRATTNDAGPADWSVITFSVADEGIALLVEPGHVYFGVPGVGGETFLRSIEKAFGADLAKLKDAVAKTLAELAAAGVVKIDAAEVKAVAGAAGLGALQKGAGGWTLTTSDCQAVDLPTSGL